MALDSEAPSRAQGTTSRGSLRNGRVIPPWGDGFVTYSFLGAAVGRQYVTERVRDTLVAAFAARAAAEHDRVFVVGETGWPHGGRFPPHRTHENGTSVDIFMPVDGADGAPSRLPTWPWSKFGYGLEFDATGKRGSLHIDFEALAQLLRELDAQAHRRGLRIQAIILAPEYVPLLLAAPSAGTLGQLAARLTHKSAWVRHDEHFHVDFAEAGPGPY